MDQRGDEERAWGPVARFVGHNNGRFCGQLFCEAPESLIIPARYHYLLIVMHVRQIILDTFIASYVLYASDEAHNREVRKMTREERADSRLTVILGAHCNIEEAKALGLDTSIEEERLTELYESWWPEIQEALGDEEINRQFRAYGIEPRDKALASSLDDDDEEFSLSLDLDLADEVEDYDGPVDEDEVFSLDDDDEAIALSLDLADDLDMDEE